MPPAKYAAGLRQTAEGGDVVSAAWKGKRDYAIKPLRRPTAGGRGVGIGRCCPSGKGIFYIAMPAAFMSLKFLKPLIIS